jgi:hypothetical protein
MWKTLGLLALIALGTCGCSDFESLVEKHDFGGRYILTLRTDGSLEEGKALFYEISTDGRNLVRKTFLCGVGQVSNPGGKYLLPGPNVGGVFSFVLAKTPTRVVVLFDSNSGESWPRGRETDVPSQTLARGETMLKTIQPSGDRPLQLYRF